MHGDIKMTQLSKIQISLPDGTIRDFFHRGSFADNGVLQQQFKDNDYSIGRLRRGADILNAYQSIANSEKKPMIIDAGANIGASAFWFAATYPGAHIVCVEPDVENFNFLKLNTQGLNVDLHNAAVGSSDGAVDLIDPGLGQWGYQTSLNKHGKTKMISVQNLVNEKIDLGFEPFIAKFDIEGGEAELFSKDTEWMDQFPLIIIELHDWLFPKQKNSANFLRAVSGLDRDFVHIGENIFSIKN
jgi:FkbM family methyltransferase